MEDDDEEEEEEEWAAQMEQGKFSLTRITDKRNEKWAAGSEFLHIIIIIIPQSYSLCNRSF